MSHLHKSLQYREAIDALVEVCRHGQGQVGARRARSGVWNPGAGPDTLPDQHQINILIASLAQKDRETLASMLSGAVETGVFETLKVLESLSIAPFEDGYEGSPYNDFIGRLSGEWEWPEQ